MLYTVFIVLICLASLLMIFIVLIQESKGGGLASNFSSTNAIMGVRKTTDFIEGYVGSCHCHGHFQYFLRLYSSEGCHRRERTREGRY